VKGRLIALVAIVAVAVAGTVWYVLHTRERQAAATANAPRVATQELAAVAGQPHIVFRNTALGEEYGRVAMVPLDAPDGPRAFTPASCERVYAAGGSAVCLSAARGLVTTFRAQLLGADWAPLRELPLTGQPSRARLSRDGRLAATTTFVFGHDYASPGQFSTETLVTRADGTRLGNLEEFTLTVGGAVRDATDRNLWGVTFADGDRFFATAASGGKTWLVEGSLSGRRLTALREDAECPSLSPDRGRIAFKKHGDLPPGHWRLAVYDLATGKETLLAEQRSVDDQVEWLDRDTIVYGLPRDAGGAATSDVWSVPADGGGAPSLLIRDAWSPAVVR
jgi:dipeptidyl aminopeptidase/acylaminoacyl peptidase